MQGVCSFTNSFGGAWVKILENHRSFRNLLGVASSWSSDIGFAFEFPPLVTYIYKLAKSSTDSSKTGNLAQVSYIWHFWGKQPTCMPSCRWAHWECGLSTKGTEGNAGLHWKPGHWEASLTATLVRAGFWVSRFHLEYLCSEQELFITPEC